MPQDEGFDPLLFLTVVHGGSSWEEVVKGQGHLGESCIYSFIHYLFIFIYIHLFICTLMIELITHLTYLVDHLLNLLNYLGHYLPMHECTNRLID